MLLKSQTRRRSPFARLMSWVGSRQPSTGSTIRPEPEFQLELLKERSRADRRPKIGGFALIVVEVTCDHPAASDTVLWDNVDERLRITDTIGWCRNKLSVLLPETQRHGACIVANDLLRIALDHGHKLETEIFVYPDDDELATSSQEYDSLQTWSGDSDSTESTTDSGQGFGGDQIRPLAMQGLRQPGERAATLRPESDSDSLSSTPQKTTRFSVSAPTPIWKRVIDVLGATTGLVVLSPLLVGTAIAIRLTSRGPVFFRQLREGKDGTAFRIFKFRTMVIDAEAQKERLLSFSQQDGPAFKIEADPRLTSIGKYLRKSCIDELPQLVNVLRGEMSLVGPRPLPVNESVACSIWHRRRLEVAPGLTCIWQVRGNHETPFDEWMRMDMEYIRRRSFVFDVQLIAETIYATLMHRGSV